MNFYMAKGCVRAGQMERAVDYLRMAINEGFTTPKKIADDEEFAALRDVPAFQADACGPAGAVSGVAAWGWMGFWGLPLFGDETAKD